MIIDAVARARDAGSWASEAPFRAYEDPMGIDRPTDRGVSTTLRGIARMALVASEAGARMERCGMRVDAMEWMSAPRRLFAGRSALEACLDLDECAKGVLIHMLEEDPDAEVEALDDLRPVVQDDDADLDDDVLVDAAGAHRRLYSCRTVVEGATGLRWCFDAFVADDAGAARRSLAARHGRAAAVAAVVSEGFDRHDPYVDALVSTRLADALELAARDPVGPVASGLDVSVAQRLAS